MSHSPQLAKQGKCGCSSCMDAKKSSAKGSLVKKAAQKAKQAQKGGSDMEEDN